MALGEQQNNSELMNFKKIRSNFEQLRFRTPRSLINALILLLPHKQTTFYLPLKLLLRNFQILLLWVITNKTRAKYAFLTFRSSSSSGAMLYSVGDHVFPYSTVPCCFQDFNHLACSQPFDKSVGHLLSLFPSAAFSFHHSCCYEMF